MSDAYIQVAPDGGGKLVDMDQVSTLAGATIYRQRAVLVGESGNALEELLTISRAQLAVSRAILANLLSSIPDGVTEDDFTNLDR